MLIVSLEVPNSYDELIALAVQRVRDLAGSVERIADGGIDVAAPASLDAPAAGKLPLSREVVGIIDEAILAGQKADSFGAALEIGYQAFAQSACTAAATEGVTAFLKKRPADFTQTG